MTDYTFDGDRLVADGAPVPYTPTRHMGGRIVPTAIVLHDTAGHLTPGNSAEFLTKNPRKVSAHFVVERDGSVVQLAPPDRRTNHAGISSWQSRKSCNGFTIGIEIVNPGKLTPRGNDGVAWFGTVFRAAEGLEDATSPAHGGTGRWMHYTSEQLDAVVGLVRALAGAYPTIEDVVGHHDVSPGRKVDPTPLMDWERVRRALHTTPAAKPPPAFETATLDAATIRAAQTKLAALGYLVPPRIDGIAGTRTRAAVFALQTEHALKPNGALDAATLALLDSGDAKPMPTGHREDDTLADLVTDSAEAQAAVATQSGGAFTAVLGSMTATTVAVAEFVTPLRTIVGDNWQLALLGVGCAIAWLGWQHWKSGRAAAAATLARHHAGQI